MNSRCSCQEGYPDQKGTQIEKLRAGDGLNRLLAEIGVVERMEAEVEDLKARLKDVREATSFAVRQGLKLPGLTARIFKCTDLRVKNWEEK